MSNIQEVERPTGKGSGARVNDELMSALMATAENNKAIQVTLDEDTPYLNWCTRIRSRLRNQPYYLRTQYNKGTRVITAWLVRNDEDNRTEGREIQKDAASGETETGSD